MSITRLLPLLALLVLPAQAEVVRDRFMVITDSHGAGQFGQALTDGLRRRALTDFTFFASGGSAPLQWLNRAFTTTCGYRENSRVIPTAPRACETMLTPRLSELWAAETSDREHERRVTVIVQGTNFSTKASLRAEQITATKKLIQAARAASDVCLWVGPPKMRRSPGYDSAGVEAKIEILQAALTQLGDQGCTFIDSRPLSEYPAQGDGIHYHWPGSRNEGALRAATDWATEVLREIEEHLARSP